MNLQTLSQLACNLRFKRFVKRARRMGVEVVPHQHDLFRLGVKLPQAVSQGVRPVDLRPAVRDADVPPPTQRFANINKLHVPKRTYSLSIRKGSPGRIGKGSRTSPTSCLDASSMQSTGKPGSYGRAWTSRTSSIRHTNSASCSLGRHHDCVNQGLTTFFLAFAARLRG